MAEQGTTIVRKDANKIKDIKKGKGQLNGERKRMAVWDVVEDDAGRAGGAVRGANNDGNGAEGAGKSTTGRKARGAAQSLALRDAPSAAHSTEFRGHFRSCVPPTPYRTRPSSPHPASEHLRSDPRPGSALGEAGRRGLGQEERSRSS